MLKILLGSESKIKDAAVKKWFRTDFKKSVVHVDNIYIDDKMIPPQPINTGGYLSCNDRIRYIRDNHSDKLEDNDYIISIENCLKISSHKIVDIVYVHVVDLKSESEFKSSGGELEVTYNILEEYPKIVDVIDDLMIDYELNNKKYIYDGCEITFGKLINKYYSNIPANNWMKTLCKTDRENQILKVLRKITKQMKEDIL